MQQKQIIGYFIEEAKEHIQTIENSLLNLDNTFEKSEILNEIFRATHHIKSGAAMLGFSSIQNTAFQFAECLKILKENPLIVDNRLKSLFSRIINLIKLLINEIVRTGELPDKVANDILSRFSPAPAKELKEYLNLLVKQKDSEKLLKKEILTREILEKLLLNNITESQPPTPEIQKLPLPSSSLIAPISVVTILEDRAQVRRIGKINLAQGLWRVVVDEVAPILSDKSLWVEFGKDYPGAIINDLRVCRQLLFKEENRPDLIKSLLENLQGLLENFNNITEDRKYQEHCFNQVKTILAKSVQELSLEAIREQINTEAWQEQLKTLFKQLRDLRGEILSNYHAQEPLHQQLDDLIEQIQAIYDAEMVYTARIEADIIIPQDGEYEIILDYVVPNAIWRPWHQAHISLEEKPTLSFYVDGCVWQCTGEDWNNVDLVFSTARASLGNEPPLLKDDFLNVKEKPQQIFIQTANQQIQAIGLETVPVPESIELPGVDDGGEVCQLRSPSKVSIPSDGKPYRVPIFSFDTEAKVEYVLMPEVICQVVIKSEQTNTSQFPILAGPVDLVRSSGIIGRTSVMLIAAGEKFVLGWGPDAAIRVRRTQIQEGEQDQDTKWNILTTKTNLFFSNIGAEPREINTTERVLISQLEQVKVEVIPEQTTNGIQPDENGFCTWKFALPPYSQLEASLVYKISAAPEVQIDLFPAQLNSGKQVKPPTVLIVDDSISVRSLLSMTFEKAGYRVEQARDGHEAWTKLKSNLFCDLVFCDIEMPIMDGLELLSRIKKDANLKYLPVAMLTSRGGMHQQKAAQLGASAFVIKPYLEEAILDAAERMMRGEVLINFSTEAPSPGRGFGRG